LANAKEREDMSAGFPRWLFVALAAIVIVVAAVWATTPASVSTLAPDWAAGCFDPIEPVDEAELVLIPREDSATLTADTAERVSVKLDKTQQESLELPKDHRIKEVRATASLESGRLEVRTNGSRFLITASPSDSFEVTSADAYPAKLTGSTTVERDEGGKFWLPKGSKVKIELPQDKQVLVKQVKRLEAVPLVLGSLAGTIRPDVRPIREVAPVLAARLTAPGLDFEPIQDTLRACLGFADGTTKRLQIARVDASTPGLAVVDLDLPNEPFPWFDWRRGRAANVAVVTTDGDNAWTGEFVYSSRSWALLLATALAVFLFVGLVWLRKAGAEWKTWFMGLFLDEDGQPSLSLFQILLWTIVTVWSLLFVFFSTGNLLTMTQQVMVLLGIAGAGSLAARWVAANRPPAPSTTRGDGVAKPPAFWAILENNGQLDLFKLQLFLFTVLIATYVVFRVVRQSAFPEIDAEFLTLMGVSNSLYVGSKFAQSSPLAVAQARKLEWDVLRFRVEDLEAETEKLKAESQALEQSIQQETDGAKQQTLIDQKTILDEKITKKGAELAQARIDRDAQETKYNEAIAALAPG
jgi:hypothetical protein